MIDFHCHLDLYEAPERVAEQAQRSGVGILSVTTTPSAWTGTSALGRNYPTIRTALGLHPQLAYERQHELRLFDQFLPETPYVGEIGLDGTPASRAFWAEQEKVFSHILERCSEVGGKVLSVHSRRAVRPVLDQLERVTGTLTPILHWFSGSQSELKRAIQQDCWFSVGPSMLAGARGRDLIAAMPRDRIVLETDGPFAQVRNISVQPHDITQALDVLATTWGVSRETTTQAIRANEQVLLKNI